MGILHKLASVLVASAVSASLLLPVGALAQVQNITRTVALQYAQFDRNDQQFPLATWRDLAERPRPPGMNLPETAFVAYVREASGSLLSINMLVAPEWCNTVECTIRIQRDGRLIKEFTDCSQASVHRITADGKFFIGCGDPVAIP